MKNCYCYYYFCYYNYDMTRIVVLTVLDLFDCVVFDRHFCQTIGLRYVASQIWQVDQLFALPLHHMDHEVCVFSENEGNKTFLLTLGRTFELTWQTMQQNWWQTAAWNLKGNMEQHNDTNPLINITIDLMTIGLSSWHWSFPCCTRTARTAQLRSDLQWSSAAKASMNLSWPQRLMHCL